MIKRLEVMPTLTNVLPVDSSFISTRYNDFGNFASFFFLSCPLFTNLRLTYSLAFSSEVNSLVSL